MIFHIFILSVLLIGCATQKIGSTFGEKTSVQEKSSEASRGSSGLVSVFNGRGQATPLPKHMQNGFLVSVDSAIEAIQIQDLGFASKNMTSEEVQAILLACSLNSPPVEMRRRGSFQLIFMNDAMGQVSGFDIKGEFFKDDSYKKCLRTRLNVSINRVGNHASE